MVDDRLTRDAWIHAAVDALITRGPRGVNVEALARSLEVTKGSFYWHFRNRAALEAAMLETWIEEATFEVIEMVERAGASGAERLDALVRASFADDGARDRAFRAWATHDPRAEETVERVDARRLAYVRDLFEAHGLSPSLAKLRARTLYAALVGEHHLSGPRSSAARVKGARDLLSCLLGPGA